ncbi:MAG: hypothetical protein OXE78_01490 [Gammaproteobacteria bacterium]|nr:hypothetical protein [Gammaproteobacteria bacterium]MCY4357358.1 hypothetical protein [Gammaproteobacteria bacterium]
MKAISKLTLGWMILGLGMSGQLMTVQAQESGRPDFVGTWTNASRTSLQRPQGVDDLVVSPDVAAQMVSGMALAGIPAENIEAGPAIDPETGAPPEGARDFGLRGYNLFWTDPGSSLAYVMGELRTSYVIDPATGRIPRREQPQPDWEIKNFGARYLTGVGEDDGPEAFPLAERCLLGFGNTAGPGMMGTLYNSTYEFIQTDEYVMIVVEMAHDARIIPVFDSAEQARVNRRPAVLKQWLGDSVGWYEDGQLIVETVNINPKQMAESSVPITADGVITERFRRFSDSEIVYQFTVNDPNLYLQPWTAELSFHNMDGKMYEYACHEGNHAMPGMLAGARRLELQDEYGSDD